MSYEEQCRRRVEWIKKLGCAKETRKWRLQLPQGALDQLPLAENNEAYDELFLNCGPSQITSGRYSFYFRISWKGIKGDFSGEMGMNSNGEVVHGSFGRDSVADKRADFSMLVARRPRMNDQQKNDLLEFTKRFDSFLELIEIGRLVSVPNLGPRH